MIFSAINGVIVDKLRAASRSSTVLAIAVAPQGLQSSDMWMLLSAGAADVFVWPKVPITSDQSSPDWVVGRRSNSWPSPNA